MEQLVKQLDQYKARLFLPAYMSRLVLFFYEAAHKYAVAVDARVVRRALEAYTLVANPMWAMSPLTL